MSSIDFPLLDAGLTKSLKLCLSNRKNIGLVPENVHWMCYYIGLHKNKNKNLFSTPGPQGKGLFWKSTLACRGTSKWLQQEDNMIGILINICII